jgi:hypothetical protein
VSVVLGRLAVLGAGLILSVIVSGVIGAIFGTAGRQGLTEGGATALIGFLITLLLAFLIGGYAAGRLASLLLRLLDSEGVVKPRGYEITTRYTHQQFANMIGANREAVTRAFGLLRGLVCVTDIEGLKRAAVSQWRRESAINAG